MRRSLRPILVAFIFGVAVLHPPAARADEKPATAPARSWVNISDPVIQRLTDEKKPIAWPGVTAGVTVDPSSGDVYLVIPGQGLWRSSDQGATFARADGGKVGGRCETGYALCPDPAGKRLACFMLDGHAAMTTDAGHTWQPFADVGRNWDYAAVDWSSPEPTAIFAARHESGGEMFLTNDAGKTWKKIGKDPKFAGVGIFGPQTLVTTKGDGILRSTDGGANWTKVSDLHPVGRVVQVYRGTAWWLGAEGMLVSTDQGVTWATRGKPVEASLGPWFKDERHFAVAGPKGIFETLDAGDTWQPVAPLPEKFDVPMPGRFSNVAWDPVHDVFYASRMGQPAYKLAR